MLMKITLNSKTYIVKSVSIDKACRNLLELLTQITGLYFGMNQIKNIEIIAKEFGDSKYDVYEIIESKGD